MKHNLRSLMVGAVAVMTQSLAFAAVNPFGLKGEGTEENPWKVSTVTDLKALSDYVNNAAPNQSNGAFIGFEGDFFELTDNLDLTSVEYTPIGRDTSHLFGGTFNGNGHTISNIVINTGSDGYAGIFGYTWSTAIITGLTVKDATISSISAYNGSIVASSLGKIIDCHVISSKIAGNGAYVGGIAGVATEVAGCSVQDCEIIGWSGYTAGAVGIANKSVSATNVNGTIIYGRTESKTGAPLGGVVAQINQGTVTDCAFAGSIRVDDQNIHFTGGIAGDCNLSTIERCMASGSVLGMNPNSKTGGVVGRLAGTLRNCGFTGQVLNINSTQTGGITGSVESAYNITTVSTQESVIQSCYTSSWVVANIENYRPSTECRETLGYVSVNANPTLENIYFNNQITNFRSTHYGISSSEMTSGRLPGFDADIWDMPAGLNPIPKSIRKGINTDFSSAAIVINDPNISLSKFSGSAKLYSTGQAHFALIKGNSFVGETDLLRITTDGTLEVKDASGFGTEFLFCVDGKSQYYFEVRIQPDIFEGDGSETSPYLLKTKEDLVKLAEITATKQRFENTWFSISNDIDFGGDTFDGISVGNITSSFQGTIHGNGHKISNMNISQVAYNNGVPASKGSISYGGFIGSLGPDGVVSDITISSDCQYKVWSNAGGIVGHCEGTVKNCRNHANIVGYDSRIGGITGTLQKTGKIIDCFNDGDVTSGFQYAGGIVGQQYGTVSQCANVGDVKVESISDYKKPTLTTFIYAGGISGYGNAAVIDNCVNAGTVYAASASAGGIAGYYHNYAAGGAGKNDMTNCISFGLVKAGDNTTAGGLAGLKSGIATTQGIIKDNYYDRQILPIKAIGGQDIAGMSGDLTSNLISGTTLDRYDTEIWNFVNGLYPALTLFANETSMANARAIVLDIPNKATINNITGNATLSQPEGIKWTLNENSGFSIKNSMLFLPDDFTDIISGTLTATIGRLTKVFNISAAPAIALKGEGTEANPYIIASTDDWNVFANYIETAKDPQSGIYYKISDDIDFSGVEFKTVSIDGSIQFAGVLDGDGHSLKGIKYPTQANYTGILFATVAESAIIQNLTMEGVVQNTQYTNIGAFVGRLYGTIKDCTNRVNVTTQGTKNYIAGFTGYAGGTARFINCVNEGNISSGGAYIAGINAQSDVRGVYYENVINKGTITHGGTTAKAYVAGITAVSKPATFINCSNSGKLIVNDTAKSGYVAGILASASTAAVADTVTCYVFDHCTNNADITAQKDVAGIISEVNTTGYARIVATDCVNNGNITSALSTSGASNSAGLFAEMTIGGSRYENLVNYGNITGMQAIAGIGGLCRTQAKLPRGYVINCTNYGKIVSNSTSGQSNAAGIIGNLANNVSIEGCANHGTVTGDQLCAGIVAQYTGVANDPLNITFSNCYNLASVTVNKGRAAGIAGGYSSDSKNLATITNCFNTGDITSKMTVEKDSHLIAGISATGNAIVDNCYNTGSITGAKRVAGICGGSALTAKITNCYNVGIINANDNEGGDIVGLDASYESSKYWNETNSVENCFSLDCINKSLKYINGTRLSVAELCKTDLGNAWAQAEFSLPVLSDFKDLNEVKLNSAAIVLAEGNDYDSITSGFNIGTPDGLTWNASTGSLSIIGNTATWNTSFEGEFTLTASIDGIEKTFTLNANVENAGIDSISIDNQDIKSTEWFNLDGTPAHNPVAGHMYIVRTTLTNNVISVQKIIK